MTLPCPTCRGTARNPDAPSEIADDDGTCLECCNPTHPWHSAGHGWVEVPCAIVADPVIRARLSAAALSGPTGEAGRTPSPPRMSSTMSLPSVTLPCPTCRGTARNPNAPWELDDDDGTCLVCCNPTHLWHSARHGWVEVPCVIVADPVIRARLSAVALSGPTMDL